MALTRAAVKEASLTPHFLLLASWLETSPFVPVWDSRAYHILQQNWADEDTEHSFQYRDLDTPPFRKLLWLRHFTIFSLILFAFSNEVCQVAPGRPQIRDPPTSVSWVVSNLVVLHRGNKNMVSRGQDDLEWAWEDWPCHNNRTLDVECPTSLSFCQSSGFRVSSLCRAAVWGNPSGSLHGIQTYQLVNNSARIIINNIINNIKYYWYYY